jgi:hypothetical protein
MPTIAHRQHVRIPIQRENARRNEYNWPIPQVFLRACTHRMTNLRYVAIHPTIYSVQMWKPVDEAF